MRKEVGGGKECEAPTHLIENSTFSHAACVTKNRHNLTVCSQEAKVTEKPGAHNPSVRFVTKDPRTLSRANGALVLLVKVGFQDERFVCSRRGSDKRSPPYLR